MFLSVSGNGLFPGQGYDPFTVPNSTPTLLHCLGLDHKRLTFRHQGRDYRLTDVGGNVVKKLLA